MEEKDINMMTADELRAALRECKDELNHQVDDNYNLSHKLEKSEKDAEMYKTWWSDTEALRVKAEKKLEAIKTMVNVLF